LAALRRLVAELAEAGLDSGWHSSGVLRIASNPKQAKLWRRREGVRWREPDELPAGYHAPYGGFLVEAGGYVEPRKLLDALLQAARHRGLGLREHCRVDALQPERESVRVEGSHGTFRADAVVLCVGASPNARLGLPRMERLAGDVIELDSNAELPYPLAGAVYGARSRDGVYVGGNHRPAGETDPDAPARLRQAASWFVPALRQAAISGVWTGVRAKTADHQPITGELRPGVWMLGALAGRGFLCSAQLAAQMADALEHRARP
ncbi:MAG TPA: FAD-dependent oxidoreductase, partial [Trueperaceae bacterium]